MRICDPSESSIEKRSFGQYSMACIKSGVAFFVNNGMFGSPGSAFFSLIASTHG